MSIFKERINLSFLNGYKIIVQWEHEIGEPKRKHKKKRIAKKWLKRYGTWTAYDKKCCPYQGYLMAFDNIIFVSRPIYEKLKHGAIYPIFKAVPHHGNNFTRY